MSGEKRLTVGELLRERYSVEQWLRGEPLPADMRAVILVAEAMASMAPRRPVWRNGHRRHERQSPMDFIPAAQVVVRRLLLTDDGRSVCRRMLAGQDEGSSGSSARPLENLEREAQQLRHELTEANAELSRHHRDFEVIGAICAEPTLSDVTARGEIAGIVRMNRPMPEGGQSGE